MVWVDPSQNSEVARRGDGWVKLSEKNIVIIWFGSEIAKNDPKNGSLLCFFLVLKITLTSPK